MALDRPAYRIKRHLLGKPLTTERISDEKLSNRTALGVLASDCISSSAYGSEEMLRVLVPVVGAAAFTLLMPVTGAILFVLLLLTLCYSDVVMIYTRAGGSYVVARENFGPNIAQIASVALLVDYIVTVAVQVSAGTNALISLAHLIGGGWTGLDHLQLPVSVAVIVLLAYGNLRGIREAGRTFALPAYLFMAAVGLVLVVAAARGLTGGLPHADLHAPGWCRWARRATAGSTAPRSSSCCGPSPTAARRSPDSKRSPTASPRSASRRAATPAARSSP